MTRLAEQKLAAAAVPFAKLCYPYKKAAVVTAVITVGLSIYDWFWYRNTALTYGSPDGILTAKAQVALQVVKADLLAMAVLAGLSAIEVVLVPARWGGLPCEILAFFCFVAWIPDSAALGILRHENAIAPDDIGLIICVLAIVALVILSLFIFANSNVVTNFEHLVADYIAKHMTAAGIVGPTRELPKDLGAFLDTATLNSAILGAVPRGFITQEELDAFVRATAAKREQARTEAENEREARLQEMLTAIQNGESINPQSTIAIPLGQP